MKKDISQLESRLESRQIGDEKSKELKVKKKLEGSPHELKIDPDSSASSRAGGLFMNVNYFPTGELNKEVSIIDIPLIPYVCLLV